jgi:hypothetical protein
MKIQKSRKIWNWNSRNKKPKKSNKNLVKCLSNRQAQLEYRISGHEDKVDVFKQADNNEKIKKDSLYIIDLTDTIQKANLKLIDIQGEAMQAKGIETIVNEVVA